MRTYAGHYRELIDACIGFGSAYAPARPSIGIMQMENQLNTVLTAIEQVDFSYPAFDTADGARRDVFAKLPPLATRVLKEAEVCNLPAAVLKHMNEIVRKIRGGRAEQIVEPGPEATAEDEHKYISVSQRSFNEQIGHFNQLLDLVVTQQAYQPAEEDLSIDSLTAFLTAMKTTNDTARMAYIPLVSAREQRDKLLYTPVTGMMDTALLAKAYVEAMFGAASPQYKRVNHITFRNRKL